MSYISIEEISDYGVKIVGAAKGKGSVNQGIQFVQDQKISITKKSLKTIKAYRNYLWAIDKNGKNLQVPDDTIHEWSNPMDAIRYGFNGTIKSKKSVHVYRPIVQPVYGGKSNVIRTSSYGWAGRFK